MKRLLLSLTLGVILFSTASVFAQIEGGVLAPEQTGGFLIGPVGGINLVSYKTDQFAILNTEPTCFTAQNGSDVCFHAGITAEIPLGETMQSFIVAEGIYDCKGSKFTTANNTRASIPTKKNGVVVNGSVTTSESASLNYFLVNVGYKYNFTTGPAPVGPGVQLCASVGIPMTATLDKSVVIVASSGDASHPEDMKNSATSIPIKDVPGASAAVRVAVRAQFTYDIPLTDNGTWVATPTVGYDLPFTKVASGAASTVPANWSASSAFGSVALRYFIGK